MSDEPAPTFREPMPPPVRRSSRLGPASLNRLQALARVGPSPLLGRAAVLVPRIRHWEKVYGKLPDSQLKTAADALRGRVRSRDEGRPLTAEAFALCSVAVWRVLGMRPYDVQLVAGLLMNDGRLVELATGEGKTLTAIFPTFLMALSGKGCHVATVNDYLAKRDAEEVVGPVHRLFGLSVGVLFQKMEDAARAEAYKCDITYATASEFGFDYLRDRIKLRGGKGAKPSFWSAWLDPKGKPLDPRVQRDLYSVIVDEADSIFIDEARTPLIISGPVHEANEEEAVVYKWADRVVREMKDGEHFTVDLKKDKVEMTQKGRHHVRYSHPPSGPHAKALDKLFEQVEKSLQAHYRFVRDQNYMISEKDKKVVIIDENTGRPMPDRQWRDGLHQAVEAKEGVPINVAGDPAASITFQSFFKQYQRVAGMSGTIIQNRRELKKVYGLRTVQVPTNRPTIRTRRPDRVFPTEDTKFDAIVGEVSALVAKGRPVLIGTRTVDKSEALSLKLKAAGIDHEVLNARFHETEAKIVEGAGQPGRVTVATNMAGRGTDIKLGPGVREAGGLHVISTELNEAVRIDRQLLGRAGRQGDPGSGQVFVSLDDDLLEALGASKQEQIAKIGKGGGSRDWTAYRRLFRLAQRKTEKKHYRQRLDLMHHEKQRRELLAELGADPFVD